MIRWILDLVGTIWVLATLGWVSRFRLRGAYWSWRMHTAFADGIPEAKEHGLFRSVFEYGRWAWRIRRLR